MESAQKAIPSNVLEQGADVSAEKPLGYLRSLLEGVQATERVLHKVSIAGCATLRLGIVVVMTIWSRDGC